MPKLLHLFLAAAILFGIASCSGNEKSAAQLIDDLRNANREMVDAVKAQDKDKVTEADNKIQEINRELAKKELTPEQQAEVAVIVKETILTMANAYSEGLIDY